MPKSNHTRTAQEPDEEKQQSSGKQQKRARDPDLARATIIRVAREHFALHGLTGARIDEIAAGSGYSKAMIYHYFGSKEAVYIAVLEETYRRDIVPRRLPRIEEVGPVAALQAFIREGADAIRRDHSILNLLSVENIHQGKYLRETTLPGTIYVQLRQQLQDIIDAGVDARIFRTGIDVTQLYVMLSSLIFHVISNRFTLSILLNTDVSSDSFVDQYIDSAIDMVVRFCLATPPMSSSGTRIKSSR